MAREDGFLPLVESCSWDRYGWRSVLFEEVRCSHVKVSQRLYGACQGND